jgi:Recombination endonuclease VII.
MANIKPYIHVILSRNRRFCNACKKAKPLTRKHWFRGPRDASGFQTPCKACSKIIHAEYYRRTSTRPRRQPRISKQEKRRRRTAKRAALKQSNPRLLKWMEKNSGLKSTYGITLRQYREIFKSQDRSCAICKCKRPRHKRFWHVDHCHRTHRVRGILCSACNVMLGHAKEHPDILSMAINYLKMNKHK